MTMLHKYWFSHENVWFGATKEDDKEIAMLFRDYAPRSPLEHVIYHDQIVRHISRVDGTDGVDCPERHNSIAIEHAAPLISGLDLFVPCEQVFILLPFRHRKTPEDLQFCLRTIRKMIRERPESNKYYRRFHNATVQAVSRTLVPVPAPPVQDWDFDGILCPNSTFDRTRPIDVRRFKSPTFRHHRKNVIVSLSGGVDSMVCVLLALAQNLNVTAIYIKYGNRQDSDQELRFISWYCTVLAVPLYCRHVTEIHRNNDYDKTSCWNREFYESHTRVIRFSAYRHVASIVCPENPELVPVVLGHNNDDAEENIFRNIQKTRSLDNLKGMKPSHVEMLRGNPSVSPRANPSEGGVLIHRPLLSMSKKWITQVAADRNVPYTYNSTPSWSERGIMREQVIDHIPVGILRGMVKHAELVTGMHRFIQRVVDDTAVETVEAKSDGEKTTWIFRVRGDEDLVFWDLMFRRLARTRVKRKCLINFVQIAAMEPNGNRRLEVGNGITVTISNGDGGGSSGDRSDRICKVTK